MNNGNTKIIPTSLAVLVVLLLSAYAYFFYVTADTGGKMAVLYSSLHQSASDEAKAHALAKSIDDTATLRSSLDSYFIRSSGAVLFLEKIEALGKQTGVSLHTSSYTVVPKTSILEDQFSADGTFSELYNLLSLVESLPYQIVIKNVSFTKNSTIESDSGSKQSWTAVFTVDLLSYIK